MKSEIRKLTSSTNYWSGGFAPPSGIRVVSDFGSYFRFRVSRASLHQGLLWLRISDFRARPPRAPPPPHHQENASLWISDFGFQIHAAPFRNLSCGFGFHIFRGALPPGTQIWDFGWFRVPHFGDMPDVGFHISGCQDLELVQCCLRFPIPDLYIIITRNPWWFRISDFIFSEAPHHQEVVRIWISYFGFRIFGGASPPGTRLGSDFSFQISAFRRPPLLISGSRFSGAPGR